ncbi:predicted protein [Arabidopsis lyrata subsp. lyrata]|uniref:Predicted protein n=1 Tax=Arabidopsis lyrata subsp. lyrata TaxID=81972 RepID=D7KKT7_ARALL|nr:predicted protein [Arabidopsis lyrata subsp. lyrata]
MSTSSDDMTVEVISNDNKSFTVPAKRLMQSKLLSFMIGDLFIEPKKIPEKKATAYLAIDWLLELLVEAFANRRQEKFVCDTRVVAVVLLLMYSVTHYLQAQ